MWLLTRTLLSGVCLTAVLATPLTAHAWSLRFVELRCLRCSDPVGPDQPYLKLENGIVYGSADRTCPEVRPGQSVNLRNLPRYTFRANEKVYVHLYEYDLLSPDDFLGGFTISRPPRAGTHKLVFDQDGGYYELTIEVSP